MFNYGQMCQLCVMYMYYVVFVCLGVSEDLFSV